MPTTKTRINISASKPVLMALRSLARRDDVPVATKTLELVEMALEMEEDLALVEIIKKREKEGKFISNEETWKGFIR